MKTSVPHSADKANPCLTQAEPTQQVNKWKRTELSLDTPNAPELAAEALCLLHMPEDVDSLGTIVLQGPTRTTLAALSPHLHSICPIRTASREHSLSTGLGSCCALPQLPSGH